MARMISFDPLDDCGSARPRDAHQGSHDVRLHTRMSTVAFACARSQCSCPAEEACSPDLAAASATAQCELCWNFKFPFLARDDLLIL